MPIYEYLCRACGKQFEFLFRGNAGPTCPDCKGTSSLERVVSIPRVHSDTTRALALKAAKQRDIKRGRDRVEEQIRYERNHEGEHH